jgi:TolB-like protein
MPSDCNYEFGPFVLVAAERRLLRDGEVVAVAPKVFDTLLVLIENSGRLVEKDELMSRLWPDTFVEEATLARNISDLRKALGQSYIETVPKHGYRFIAQVRELIDDDAMILLRRRTRSQVVIEEENEERPQVEGDKLRGIAVLPFRPISEKSRDEYLELGIADALITRLSKINRLVVRPTSTVRRYAEIDIDPVAAGRELKVESVLEGSIQKSGAQVRITARLITVESGQALWADTFDERFTDIFAVEDSISEKVASALALRLSGEEKERLTHRHTENAEAYQLYLKGRYCWNRRTVEGIKRSIDYYQKAIDLDPGYALAYAGLADSYTLLGDVGVGAITPGEAFAKGKAAVIAALQFDDSLAEAHASLAHLNMHHYQWADAEQEFHRAIRLSPNYSTSHHWYAYYLVFTGRTSEALAEIKLAEELDPLSPSISADVGDIFYFARRYDEAIEKLRQTIESDPRFFRAHLNLARAYQQKRMHEEALAEFQTATSLAPDNLAVFASLAHARAVSGRQEEARAALAQLIEMSKQKYVSPYLIAIIHAGLGQQDEAFEFLDRADQSRAEWMIYLSVDPRFDCLRKDARFQDLLRRAGFEE